MAIIENRISFILPNAGKQSKEVLHLIQQAGKNKSDIEFLIPAAFEASFQDASCKEWIEKGKLLFYPNGVWSSIMEQVQGTNVYFIRDVTTIQLPSLSAWVNSNKKEHIPQTLYYASRFHDKKTAWVEKIYDAGVRFFSPARIRDFQLGVLFAQRQTLVDCFASNDLKSQDFDMLSLHLQYEIENHIPFQSIATDKLTKHSWGQILGTPLLFFKYLLSWFLISPLSTLSIDIKNGNRNAAMFRLLFLCSTLFMLIWMPLKSLDFGLTWDSKLHNEYGYQMLKYFESGKKDTTCFTSHRDYPFYGEHINVIASYINKNYEPSWGEFGTRHILNALYGFFAILFCGLSARLIGGWRMGIIALWTIFLTPSFFGHSMNNPTDIPLATGFSIGLYGILQILRQLPKVEGGALVVFAVGLGVAIGSRIVGIMLVAYLGLFLGLIWLYKTRKEGFAASAKYIFPYAKALIIASVLGYLMGLSLWPYGQFRPIANPLEAMTRSANNAFYAYNLELWQGQKTYMVYAPWYYVLKFFSITWPLFVLAGAIIGIGFAAERLRKGKDLLIAAVLFTAFFPLMYAELKNITYYNGWRHYLFVFPSFAVIAAYGWNRLFQVPTKIIRITALLLLLGLAGKSTFWMIKNHPNEYVYFNELIGGIDGAYGNYETDYYSNSCREAAEWIVNHEPKNKKIKIGINNEPLTASYWAKRINDSVEVNWMRDYEEEKQFWDYQILTTRTYSKTQLTNGCFPPKGTVYMVKADDVPLAVVVKREVYYMPLGYRAVDNKLFDSAVYYFNQAVQWDPKSEEAHRMHGFALMLNNQFTEADKEFDEAIKLYPENYSAYSNKGLMYFNLHEYQKCIDWCEKAVKYKENLTEAYYYAALAHLNLNDAYGSISTLERAITFNSSTPEVFYYLGKSYEAVNNNNKAAEAFEHCLGVNPNMVQAWGDLANMYSKLGRNNDAQYCMQKYQQLGGH